MGHFLLLDPSKTLIQRITNLDFHLFSSHNLHRRQRNKRLYRVGKLPDEVCLGRWDTVILRFQRAIRNNELRDETTLQREFAPSSELRQLVSSEIKTREFVSELLKLLEFSEQYFLERRELERDLVHLVLFPTLEVDLISHQLHHNTLLIAYID